MICGCLIHCRDQPGTLQVPGLKEEKPLQPPLCTYQEKTAHIKPRNNNKIDCFLEWAMLNYTVWEVKSWCKRTVLILGVEGDAWGPAQLICEDRLHRKKMLVDKLSMEVSTCCLPQESQGGGGEGWRHFAQYMWDEELPFKRRGFVVMMNGEESLWGEEGASYKPSSLYQSIFTMENTN